MRRIVPIGGALFGIVVVFLLLFSTGTLKVTKIPSAHTHAQSTLAAATPKPSASAIPSIEPTSTLQPGVPTIAPTATAIAITGSFTVQPPSGMIVKRYADAQFGSGVELDTSNHQVITNITWNAAATPMTSDVLASWLQFNARQTLISATPTPGQQVTSLTLAGAQWIALPVNGVQAGSTVRVIEMAAGHYVAWFSAPAASFDYAFANVLIPVLMTLSPSV